MNLSSDFNLKKNSRTLNAYQDAGEKKSNVHNATVHRDL